MPDPLRPPLPQNCNSNPIAIISGTGKATDFKFGRYIQGVHLNKSPSKIWQKKERGHMQGLSKIFEYPYYLRVKLHELQLLYAFVDRSEQKPIKNFGKSSHRRTPGLSKIFRALIFNAHRAVVFAIAQLSCLFGC